MLPGYRNQPGPPQPVPVSRRGPGPIMPGGPPPAFHPQQQAAAAMQQAQRDRQQQLEREDYERMKARSRVPTDRQIPPGVEDFVIGDGVKEYNTLREIERRLDSTMMRKRLDITDSVQRKPKQYGTMRIWITNTAENQPWQTSGLDHDAFDFSSNVEATYRVKIVGKLLDTDGPGDPGDASSNGNGTSKQNKAGQAQGRSKLSHFFRSITVEFDRPSQFQPDNFNVVEWRRDQQGAQAEFDSIEFERKSDDNINVMIRLVRHEEPQRYKLREPLARMLDMEEADRQTVLMAIWEYIRAAGLQHDPDNRNVRCDRQMREVFGTDAIYFPHLPRMIETHMIDPPPLSLPYTIRVDKTYHNLPESRKCTIYDVPVPLEDPLQKQMLAVINSPDHGPALQKIADLDRNIALVVQKMNQTKAKHDFFTAMSEDPANFLRRWNSSQKRDLDVILGAGAWGDEDWQGAEWRRGGGEGPWGSTEAVEGIGSYLSRQDVLRAAAAAAAPGPRPA